MEDKNLAKEHFGIQRSMEQDHYLGLPLLFGRSKAKELTNIKKRVKSTMMNQKRTWIDSSTTRILLLNTLNALEIKE